MSRSVVVTGATGFIGGHLVARLRENGWTVTGVSRPETRGQLPPGIAVGHARLVADELVPIFQGADAVVHLAGVTRAGSERHYHLVNADCTHEVALAARRADVRLVHVSSQAAAGCGTLLAPRLETDQPAPLTAYGRSKLAGEAAVRRVAGLDWMILRPVAVYGPGDRAFLPLFRLACRGVFPHVRNQITAYSLIHVQDVASAIELALSNSTERHEVFFIGHERPATEKTVAMALAQVAGRRYRPLAVPRSCLWALAELGELSGRWGRRPSLDRSRLSELTSEGFVCSVEKAARKLEFRAEIELRPGLASTAAWYREKGWL